MEPWQGFKTWTWVLHVRPPPLPPSSLYKLEHKHHCKCIIQTSEDMPPAQVYCWTCIIGAGSNKTFTCEDKSALVSSYNGTHRVKNTPKRYSWRSRTRWWDGDVLRGGKWEKKKKKRSGKGENETAGPGGRASSAVWNSSGFFCSTATATSKTYLIYPHMSWGWGEP